MWFLLALAAGFGLYYYETYKGTAAPGPDGKPTDNVPKDGVYVDKNKYEWKLKQEVAADGSPIWTATGDPYKTGSPKVLKAMDKASIALEVDAYVAGMDAVKNGAGSGPGGAGIPTPPMGAPDVYTDSKGGVWTIKQLKGPLDQTIFSGTGPGPSGILTLESIDRPSLVGMIEVAISGPGATGNPVDINSVLKNPFGSFPSV